MKHQCIVLAALWRKELIALSRDRHGLLALFAMPAIFIVVMSLALQNAFSSGADIDLRYVLADLDRSPQSAALAERLAAQGRFDRREDVPDIAAARAAIARGEAAAALVIPPRFGTEILNALTDGAPVALRVVIDPAAAPAALQAFQGAVIAARYQLTLAEILQHAPVATRVPTHLPPLTVESATTLAATPGAVQQSVPAWLIFSMFFVVIPLSAIFIAERRDGTLQRLKSMRVPFGSILAGKLIPFCLVNQVQTVLMMLAGRYLVPLVGGEALILPENWLALWLIALCVSLAAIGWALLIATLTRTSEQATIIGGVGNILMGAIGGIMVPKAIMPATLQQLTVLSPMAWALEGFHNVMLRELGIGGILQPGGALLAFALLSLCGALLVHRQRMHP